MLYIIIKNFSLIIFKLIFRLKIIGSENIPKTGSFIIVANHSSLLDGFVLVSSVRPKITFMSAAYLFKMSFVGNILRGVGAIPVQGKGSDIKLIKEAMKVLQAGGVLGIFPEGRIINEKDDFSAKTGAAYLAIKADVPITVVATDIETGEEVLINKGSVSKAILASSAFPGIFAPVEINNRWLVDGVLVNPLPIQTAFDMGADIVIAVDVSSSVDNVNYLIALKRYSKNILQNICQIPYVNCLTFY